MFVHFLFSIGSRSVGRSVSTKTGLRPPMFGRFLKRSYGNGKREDEEGGGEDPQQQEYIC